MEPSTTKGQDAVKKAQALLDEIQNDNEMFEKKTGDLINSINSGLDDIEKDMALAEEKLEAIEKETIEKVDEIVVDSFEDADDDEDTIVDNSQNN